MKQFPIFVSVEGRRIVVSGGGETALAKLRLLIKSSAQVDVYASDPIQGVVDLASSGQIDLHHRSFRAGDAAGAVLFYAANDDAIDFEYAAWARADGALANVVDNPDQSDFFTPAIV
ncbi:MAG: uroporphyrinogen-III C-methyltransferase, partial [Rhodobacteraceae bacterium]|nr:uroporphyrinogen-III C-methyltransferase [Paracoccaceae bacterium]